MQYSKGAHVAPAGFDKTLTPGQLTPNIGLITGFDAILTGRQSDQKLQCFYGNPMANDFFQN